MPKSKPDDKTLPFERRDSFVAVKDGTKVASISDLHIGVYGRNDIGGRTHISDAEIIAGVKGMIAKLKPAEGQPTSHFVLNGDIFEMLYCDEPADIAIRGLSQEEHDKKRDKIREDYIAILREFIDTAKENHCQLHYVCGNHDDNSKFINKVRELANQEGMQASFRFHPVALQLGSVLFTHGDLALADEQSAQKGGYQKSLKERRLDNELLVIKKHGTGELVVTDAFNRWARIREIILNAKLHPLVETLIRNYVHTPITCAAKIFTALNNAGILNHEQDIPAITRVCTGHTHDGYVGLRLSQHDVTGIPDNRIDHAHGAIAEEIMAQIEAKLHNIRFDNTGAGVSHHRLHAIEYTLNANHVADAKKMDAQALIPRERQPDSWAQQMAMRELQGNPSYLYH